MKRIAIFACLRSNEICAGCACLNAFYDRTGAFARYGAEELRLTAFLRCSHCVDADPEKDAGLLEKADRLVSEGTEIVHAGICTVAEDGSLCPNARRIIDLLEARGLSVVYGTHPSRRSF